MASVTASGGVSDLRDRIESAAQDESLDATDRYRLLAALRDELIDVLGACDTYMGTLNKLREAQAADVRGDIAQAREIATLRETLIDQGIADSHELDEAGFLSHSDLDALEEEGLLLEAVGRLKGRWSDLLHPRGRGGKFINAPDSKDERRFDPVGVDMSALNRLRDLGSDVGIGAVQDAVNNPPPYAVPEDVERLKNALAAYREERDASWTNLSDAEVRKRYTPPFSSAVAKLTGWKDTQDYLKGIGLADTDLEPTPDTLSEKADADFYRSIAQAVTDAKERFPSLMGGTRALKAIRMAKESDGGFKALVSDPHDPEDPGHDQTVWGATSTEESWLHGDGSAQHGSALRSGPQVIAISPKSNLLSENTNVTEFASPVTGSIYGRMMHEIGHAVADSNGMPQDAIINLLQGGNVSPVDINSFSPYGSSGASEGWAEAFAMLNVPHGLDDLWPEVRDRLLNLQSYANRVKGAKIL